MKNGNKHMKYEEKKMKITWYFYFSKIFLNRVIEMIDNEAVFF